MRKKYTLSFMDELRYGAMVIEHSMRWPGEALWKWLLGMHIWLNHYVRYFLRPRGLAYNKGSKWFDELGSDICELAQRTEFADE